ncbi:MAG: hypothetical protein NC331_00430 [Lachnospiraceae bacterium]|nr:hypothetical protein [Lachnospiraceae bacterium]MCM1237833.1 hypothetical protein [Lachnospiraceae bacterium]
MKEREISLLDLLVETLLKWRVIIVWALVGGILMGCFSYVRSYRTAQTQKAQAMALERQFESGVQTEQEYLQNGLANTQINNVNTVLDYESLWKAEDAYLQESVKMLIDPLNAPRATLTFQVVAEDVEIAERIEQVYEDMVPDGVGQWLAEKTQDGTSEVALSELISSQKEYEEKSDTFRVTIYHISEEQCLQLAEKVDEYFQEQQPMLARKMGDHQIQLVAQNFSYVVDRVLLENRQKIQSNMINWRTNAAKLKDAFSAAEWEYYDYLVENKYREDLAGVQQSERETQGVAYVTVIQPSISKKYVLMGMVLFAFIYAFYFFVKYILNNRLRAVDDVVSIYGVPELGVIPVGGGGKKIFSFVDNWILKLRNWNKRSFAAEEAIGLAAVAVKMAAKKENLSEVCCIGCDLKENAVKTAEAIQSILKDADISVKVLDNVLYDQETMEQLLSAKGAFLLERVGGTLYDEISREIELLHRQEIMVLGIIVVE